MGDEFVDEREWIDLDVLIEDGTRMVSVRFTYDPERFIDVIHAIKLLNNHDKLVALTYAMREDQSVYEALNEWQEKYDADV